MTHHKICCLGDEGVGKTALTVQLCSNQFDVYDPIIRESYRKQVMIDGECYLLEIVDTPGQEEFTAVRDQRIRDCEGFVIVYSITSFISFEQVSTFKEHVIRVKDADTLPMMIVGNKCDLETKREVSTFKGQDLACTFGALFKETSAKNRINVEEVFYDMIRSIRAFSYKNPTKKPGLTKNKRGSCSLL